MTTRYKIVVFVPISHADQVREAMGNAGAGNIGNYSHCFFSSKGHGSFVPLKGSNPTIGEIGKSEKVEEAVRHSVSFVMAFAKR